MIPVTLPLISDEGWPLFTFDYMTQDGLFSGYLYAMDMGHAEQLLQELKVSAVLRGQMVQAGIPDSSTEHQEPNRDAEVSIPGGGNARS